VPLLKLVVAPAVEATPSADARTIGRPVARLLFQLVLPSARSPRLPSGVLPQGHLGAWDAEAIEQAVAAVFVTLALRLSPRVLQPIVTGALQWALADARSRTAGKRSNASNSAAAPADADADADADAALVAASKDEADTPRSLHASRIIAVCTVLEAGATALGALFLPPLAASLSLLSSGLAHQELLVAPSFAGPFVDHSGDDAPFGISMPPPTAPQSVTTAASLHCLRCLRHLADCDEKGWLTPERYAEAAPALLAALRLAHIPARAPVADAVPAVLAQLAKAAAATAGSASEAAWRPVHMGVLQLCENKRSAVRLAGIATLASLFTVVGAEYLCLLAPTMPAIAELLEDADAEVEAATRRLVQQLETLTGESFSKFLA
jgi:hypothetical protein